MMHIDEQRVLASLRRLATFGAEGRGISRPAFSAADMAARRWLADEMSNAGLEPTLDSVGNLYGKQPNVERTLLLGSHADSVPNGGWLDGALGVIYGIEVARAWRQAYPNAATGIDVIAFSDEEGHFLSCLGSRSFCDRLSAADFDALVGADASLGAAMATAALPKQRFLRLDPARHVAYLEAHIERGPKLDNAGLDVGVVTGIAGMRRFQVSFAGQADHAGTTPMDVRRDAGMAAFAFATLCHERFLGLAGHETVWNMGALSLRPGVTNVVPAFAELTVEVRDLQQARIDSLGEALIALAHDCNGRHGVTTAVHIQSDLAPLAMDGHLRDIIERQAIACGASYRALPSGAFHDAMLMAQRVPTAMLFIPSIGGRSHSPDEDSAEAHIKTGARVFASAAEVVTRTLPALDVPA